MRRVLRLSTPEHEIDGWLQLPGAKSTVGANLVEAIENWAMCHGFKDIASDTEIANGVSGAARLAHGYTAVGRLAVLRKTLG